MNVRPGFGSGLAATVGRVRAAGLRSWLLAGAAIVLLVGVLAVLGSTAAASVTDPGGPSTAALDGTMTGADRPTNLAASRLVLGEGPATGLPGVVDLVAKGILVLALLLITLRVLRRYSTGANAPTARLIVLESRSLAQRATLHLVAVGERRLVLGLTPNGLVSLAELSAEELPDGVAVAEPGGMSFGADVVGGRPAERFARILAEFGGRRAGTR